MEWYRRIYRRYEGIFRYTIDEWVTRKLQDKEVEPQPQQGPVTNLVTTGITIPPDASFTVTACTVFDPAQYQLWQQPKP
jgi:hypothetical protein